LLQSSGIKIVVYIRQVFLKFKASFQSLEAVDLISNETIRVFEQIKSIQSFEVLKPADAVAKKAWDLNLIVNFDSLQDIEKYKNNADHREYVDEYLKDKIEVIKAWNFETRKT